MSAGGGVTLKLATSLDGRIATASGESRWITGPEARRAVHELRAAHDAVLVGIDTVIADDPELTVRLDGYAGPQPARVVLDSRQRLPPSSRLAQTARVVRTLVASPAPPDPALLALGVSVLRAPAGSDGRPEIVGVLRALQTMGLERILVEGGGRVAASVLLAGKVDRVEWLRAPILLGAEGRPALAGLGLERLADAPRFKRLAAQPVGADLWERYERG